MALALNLGSTLLAATQSEDPNSLVDQYDQYYKAGKYEEAERIAKRPSALAETRVGRSHPAYAAFSQRSSRASFAECREPTKKEGPEGELRPKL